MEDYISQLDSDYQTALRALDQMKEGLVKAEEELRQAKIEFREAISEVMKVLEKHLKTGAL